VRMVRSKKSEVLMPPLRLRSQLMRRVVRQQPFARAVTIPTNAYKT